MLATVGVRKRVAAVAAVVGLALSAAGCLADSSTTPPADPLKAAIFTAINAQRAAQGWTPVLNNSPRLEVTAQAWSDQMANGVGLNHQNLSNLLFNDPNYSHYSTLGENLLVGPANLSADQIVQAWMNSPPHRANILNPYFNVAGIGLTRDSHGQLWVCMDYGGLR